jgi:hypothetical protein
MDRVHIPFASAPAPAAALSAAAERRAAVAWRTMRGRGMARGMARADAARGATAPRKGGDARFSIGTTCRFFSRRFPPPFRAPYLWLGLVCNF